MFVEERRSDDRVVGPSDEGAALIMMHSVEQQDKWCNALHFHSRLGENAVNHMASRREALLQVGAAHAEVVSAQPAVISAQPEVDAAPEATPDAVTLTVDSTSKFEFCGAFFFMRMCWLRLTFCDKLCRSL